MLSASAKFWLFQSVPCAVIVGLALLPRASSQTATHPASSPSIARGLCQVALPESRGKSWGWGGGHGYPDIINLSTCAAFTFRPSDPGRSDGLELRDFIADKPAGSVIYLPPSLDIDMSGTTLVLHDGITLAGD